MGLRFRKSVTLCKGIRLNFGKTGMSLTTGTRGLHSTYNFSTGKTTTSVGLPGTGISYVTTSGGNRRSSSSTSNSSYGINRIQNSHSTESFETHEIDSFASNTAESARYSETDEGVLDTETNVSHETINPIDIISYDRLKSIHYCSDQTIDWTEMLIQDSPPSDCTDDAFWKYCHDLAYEVLNGNIDTYFKVIQDVGPFDDLLEFGFGFECGTDNPNQIEVDFVAKENEIMPPRAALSQHEYNDLLQDYICSCSIRVARDMFALLPVSNIIVNATANEMLVLSVKFDRRVFTKMKFQGTDASDFVEKFQFHMNYNSVNGFSPISKIDN